MDLPWHYGWGKWLLFFFKIKWNYTISVTQLTVCRSESKMPLLYWREYHAWFSGKVQDFPSCFHLALNLLTIIIPCSGNINNNLSANSSQWGSSLLFVRRNKLVGSGVSVSPENLLQKFKSFLKEKKKDVWATDLRFYDLPRLKVNSRARLRLMGMSGKILGELLFFFNPMMVLKGRRERINNKIANHSESNKPV